MKSNITIEVEDREDGNVTIDSRVMVHSRQHNLEMQYQLNRVLAGLLDSLMTADNKRQERTGVSIQKK